MQGMGGGTTLGTGKNLKPRNRPCPLALSLHSFEGVPVLVPVRPAPPSWGRGPCDGEEAKIVQQQTADNEAVEAC